MKQDLSSSCDAVVTGDTRKRIGEGRTCPGVTLPLASAGRRVEGLASSRVNPQTKRQEGRVRDGLKRMPADGSEKVSVEVT